MAQANGFHPGLLNEVRGLSSVFWNERDWEAPDAPVRFEDEIIFFLGGIASIPQIYRSVASEISRQTGITVEFPRIGSSWLNMNWRLFEESLDILREEIEGAHRRRKRVVGVIGYSLGGIQGAPMLEEYPEIQRLWTLASPIWGTPVLGLQLFASWRLGFDVTNPPVKFVKMRRRLPCYADRIVTMASPFDLFAPPSTCRIRRARNIIFTPKTAREMCHPHRVVVHTNFVTHPAIPRIVTTHFHDRVLHPMRACA